MNDFPAIDLLNKGGLLVWPILICSIIGTTIFFERLTLYRKIQKYFKNDDTTYQTLLMGSFEESKKKLREQLTEFSGDKRIILEALDVENPTRETIEMVITHGVEREMFALSRTLSTLAVIASVCPLLGLLGTVIGMIKAFTVVESMGGSVNAAVLAGGIWEAMLTTAVGLLAAIPLLFFHNHLEARLHFIQAELEEVAISFMKMWSKGFKNAELN